MAARGVATALCDESSDGGGDDFDFVVYHGLTPQHLKHADLSPATMVRNANRQAHLTFAKSVKFVNDLRVVYEIQTRLQPETEPSPARPTSEENTPTGKPQEKSQTSPRPGHSQARSTALFAAVVGIGAPRGFFNPVRAN